MPATYDDYPTTAKLTTFLAGWGLALPTDFSSDVYIFTAINEWERLTRYHPFLASTSTAYRYDPPGPNKTRENRGGAKRLFLDRGFVTITEVVSGITTSSPDGTVLVVDTDYRLWPSNVNVAPDLKPYTIIDFIGYQHGEPRSIKVTGVPGYSTVLTAETYQAVMHLAAAAACDGIREGIASEAVEWAEGDVRERKSVELADKLGMRWSGKARAIAMSYRRAIFA